MPHFGISPEGWSIGDLLHGSIPSLAIDWYAKAMPSGMILDGPSVFGMKDGRLLAGGESGKEVVVGANSLMGMIDSTIKNAMALITPISAQSTVIELDTSSLEAKLKSAAGNMKVEVALVVDVAILAKQIVRPMNAELAKIAKRR